MSADPVTERVERHIADFSVIYLGGIPAIITNDSAFLSFISVLAAIESLAGCRYAPSEPKAGERFRMFIDAYFPPAYKPHATRLWQFRCKMFHAFSPQGFSLIHHHSEVHLSIGPNGNPILNAEDFYAALVVAAQKVYRTRSTFQVVSKRGRDLASNTRCNGLQRGR